MPIPDHGAKMSFTAIVSPLALLVGLSAAVLVDLRRHRIPNSLVLVAFLTALALQSAAGGWQGLSTGLLGAATGLVCFMPFYLLRGMGAGDVKLLACVGAFLGPKGALLAALAALMAGGLGAILYVGMRASLEALRATSRGGVTALIAAAWIGADSARRDRLPYALPIAVGGCISLYLLGALAPLVHSVGL
jgi:prepilin peptidase CpaA